MFGHNFHLLCFLDCEPAYRMTRRTAVLICNRRKYIEVGAPIVDGLGAVEEAISRQTKIPTIS